MKSSTAASDPKVVNWSDVFEPHLLGKTCNRCEKTLAVMSCRGCTKVYCSDACMSQDAFPHGKMCGKYWCFFDASSKKHLLQNNVPCPKSILRNICHCCYQLKSTKTRRCGDCKAVRYCSVECQERDWNVCHEKLCDTCQRFQKSEKLKRELKKSYLVTWKQSSCHWVMIKDGKPLPQKYLDIAEVASVRDRLVKQGKGSHIIIEKRSTLDIILLPGAQLSRGATVMLAPYGLTNEKNNTQKKTRKITVF